MTLSPEQRAKVVDYLGGPCQLREAADMIGVGWPQFAADYTQGMADAEAGRDSEAASWYLDCRAERSRTLAKLRAEAHATAGSRESGDLLRLLDNLTSEPEPVPSTFDNPRASGTLRAVDLKDDPRLTDEQRAELDAAHEAHDRAGLDLFAAIMNAMPAKTGSGALPALAERDKG